MELNPIKKFFRHIFHPDRLKVEFYPAIINLPLVGIFFGLLLSNKDYWTMFNGIIAPIFGGIQFNYIMILLVILGIIGAYSIGLILIGFFRLDIVHRPLVNIFPTLFLSLMVTILIIVLGINQRVGLEYIYFSLGPEKSALVYWAVGLVCFIIISFLVIGIMQLAKSSPIGTGNYEGKKFHPKLAASTTLISACLSMPVIWLLLFAHPDTKAYLQNINVLYARYIVWDVLSIIATIIGVLLSSISPILKKSDKSKQIVLIGGVSLQIFAIIRLVVLLNSQIAPYYSDLSNYLVIPLIGIMLLSVWGIWKNIYQKYFVLRIENTRSPLTAKAILVLSLLFIPYWFILFQAVSFGAPAVDLPPQTKLVTINGISVPFQGSTAYPNFEWQPTVARQYINLSGEWKSYKENSSNPDSMSPRTPALMTRITNGQHLSTFDDSNWEKVQLPAPVSYYEDQEHFWGVIWYRKNITIPTSFANQDIDIKFLGVNYYCDLWIDGTYVGYHEGAFTAFAFDISNLTTPGEHTFAIRVDCPEWGKDPFYNHMIYDGADFFNYMGIEREFYLEAAPNPSIVRVDVRQQTASTPMTTTNFHNGSQKIELDIVVKCPPSSVSLETGTLSIAIYPLNFTDANAIMSRETWNYIQYNLGAVSTNTSTIDLGDSTGIGYTAKRITLLLNEVNFWSTKSPNLYAVNVNLTTTNTQDVFYTQTGFRNITTSGNQFLLNGASLKLAGCSIHEQMPKPTGRTFSDVQRYTDLALLKNMSGNWWRAHYSLHPLSYLYSDRLGLGCWEEAPVNWENEINFVQGINRGIFQAMWIEILYRDFNRPSVLFWGACNEPWAQGPLYDYLDQTKQFLDIYDPSRIMSFAAVSSHTWSAAFGNLRACTPNTYAGTFEGVQGDWYNELTKQLWRLENNTNNQGKPLMTMEFGYWRSGVNDSDQVRCFSETFQALTENPNVQGMTWWIFADYFGPNYHNSMGIYNNYRNWTSPTYSVMLSGFTNFTKNNQ